MPPQTRDIALTFPDIALTFPCSTHQEGVPNAAGDMRRADCDDLTRTSCKTSPTVLLTRAAKTVNASFTIGLFRCQASPRLILIIKVAECRRAVARRVAPTHQIEFGKSGRIRNRARARRRY